MSKADEIMIDLFGNIKATTAGIYYKPLKELIKYLEKISPQHYTLFYQPYIENSIKIIAEHFGIEYRVGKYFPEDILAIIVDTERIYPKIETQFEQLDRKIKEWYTWE